MIALESLLLVQDGFRLTASCRFRAGEVTALIGPSGAGKSTLLSAIAGFLAPRAGRVVIDGADMTGRDPAERPVTLLFQEHNLFPHLRVWQNVGLGLDPRLRLTRAQRTAVEAALEEVGLPGMGGRRPVELSGGQRQRVALARAMLRRKPVLLLDEPFAALGPGLRQEMLDLVAGIAAREAMTVLMVTHMPADARAIASETALVADGRVEAPRPTADVFAAPTGALAAYLGAGGA